MPEDTLTQLSRRGLAIYEEKLKASLEPDQNGRFVAIRVQTGDYAVGRSSSDATRQILKVHPPDGQLVIRKIGPEPEYGLAARYLAGEMLAAQRK